MPYTKSRIFTIDILTFDGRLDYSGYLSDHQVFLNWLQSMDHDFTRYLHCEIEKVKFAIRKLI